MNWRARQDSNLWPLPSDVAAIAFHNKALVYDLLFRAASKTLMTIAADPRRLGARIVVTAVLHAWDRFAESGASGRMVAAVTGMSRAGQAATAGSPTPPMPPIAESDPNRPVNEYVRVALESLRSRKSTGWTR